MRIRTPYVVRPWLLARKAAGRLGLRLDACPDRPPEGAAAGTIPHAATLLRDWIARIGPPPPDVSWGRLFDEDHPPADLMDLCRGAASADAGPRADLRWRWEFGRLHVVFLRAAAAGPDGRDAVARASAAWLAEWEDACGAPGGPAWTCAMEAALRAVNLLAADSLLDGRLAQACGTGRWARLLWRCGAAVWNGLEAGRRPSNHYLADLLGLLWLGAAFGNRGMAARWTAFARDEIPRVLLRQTEPDGGWDEASLPYHGLATEMALAAAVAAPGLLAGRAAGRLEAMVGIVCDFARADGSMVAFGDEDSGRVWPLDRFCAGGRGASLAALAGVVLGRSFAPRPTAFCPRSGWWAARCGGHAAWMEFGGTGMNGWGSHAHNDDLSVCCDWNGSPLLDDPGSYLYTGDPDARNRLRSTAAHNTVRVDEIEQRPVPAGGPAEQLFLLRGRAKSWPAALEGAHGVSVEREVPVRGESVRHRRTVSLEGGELLIEDRLEGRLPHTYRWTLQFAAGATVEAGPSGFRVRGPRGDPVDVRVEGPRFTCAVEPGGVSPCFGRFVSAPRAAIEMKAEGPADLRILFGSPA